MIQKSQKPNSQIDLNKIFLKDFQLDSKLKNVKQSQDGKIITEEGQGYADFISQSKIQINDIIEFKLKLIFQHPFGVLNIGVRNMQNSSTYFSFYGCQYQVNQPIFLQGKEILQILLDMTQQRIQCVIGNLIIQKDLIKERSRSGNQNDKVESWFPESLKNDPSSEWYIHFYFTKCCIQILDE